MTELTNFPPDREAFYKDIDSHNMAPLWEVFRQLITPHPRPKAVPHCWHYGDVRDWVMRAGEVISAKEAERRVLVLENPGLRGQTRITNSLYAGLQLILPGEIAPSHRHSQSALRFIVEGTGAYTAVDGERAYMERGDLILTPPMTWHDHGSDGSEPTIWLDGLDIPIIQTFDASFLEGFPEDSQPSTRPPGDSRARYGRNMRPMDCQVNGTSSPVFSYPYEEYRGTLEKMREQEEWDPCHGLKMTFINPLSGGPVMPTIAAFVQLLPKEFSGAPYRSTDGTVYSVVDGTGRVEIDDLKLNVSPRDVFVVPSWSSVRFIAADDMVLFSFSDRSAQEKLGIWREQRDIDGGSK